MLIRLISQETTTIINSYAIRGEKQEKRKLKSRMAIKLPALDSPGHLI